MRGLFKRNTGTMGCVCVKNALPINDSGLGIGANGLVCLWTDTLMDERGRGIAELGEGKRSEA